MQKQEVATDDLEITRDVEYCRVPDARLPARYVSWRPFPASLPSVMCGVRHSHLVPTVRCGGSHPIYRGLAEEQAEEMAAAERARRKGTTRFNRPIFRGAGSRMDKTASMKKEA